MLNWRGCTADIERHKKLVFLNLKIDFISIVWMVCRCGQKIKIISLWANTCCGASGASEQYYNQDLERIHHFLPECNAFNQSALRHVLPEYIAPRTTLGCHTVFSRGFQ